MGISRKGLSIGGVGLAAVALAALGFKDNAAITSPVQTVTKWFPVVLESPGTPVSEATPTTPVSEDILTETGRSTLFLSGTDADFNTAFEIANSGGVNVPVGHTVEVSGLGGTQTLINTGYGYAVLTPEYQAAIQTVSANLAAYKSAVITKGFATQAQLDKMGAEQLLDYVAAVLANNPTLLDPVKVTTTKSTSYAPVATAQQVAEVQEQVSTWSQDWQDWYDYYY